MPIKALKITSAALFVALTLAGARAEQQAVQDVRLGNYIVPGPFGLALQQGITVPVLLRFRGAQTAQPQKVADARVELENGHLLIRDISLSGAADGARLSEATETLLNGLKSRQFDDGTRIVISRDAELNLDVRSFTLSLDVSRESLTTAVIPRSSMLPNSSVHALSSILNYDVGVYRTQVKKGNNTSSSYLNLDNTLGFAEHHLNINGSFYGIGSAQSDRKLYRAMYERDTGGRRIAIGLLDTWNLQSLGRMSGLNSSRVYGASYGTRSATRVTNNQYSLTPITVFLPSAGEVHIYRQGRLISIQNFPMGSFEVDTGSLPYGLYEVEVEVVIDGKVASRMTRSINKSFAVRGTEMNRLSWQVYAGTVEYHRRLSRRHRDGDIGIDDSGRYGSDGFNSNKYKTYLTGMSASVTYPVMSGLSIQTSNYSFDGYVVNETSADLALYQYATLGWQGLISQGGTYRNIFNASLQLPGGIGSLWANREKSHIRSGLPVYESNTYSYGGTLSLTSISDRAGQITVSHTVDRRDRSRTNNFEYSTSLFSGSWGTVNLRAGVQRYQYDYQSNNVNQRYVSLDFSLPLATWLSTGMSSNNGSVKASLSASRSFEDSPINSAGLNLSKLVQDKHNGEGDYAASGYAAFDTRYSTGTVSLSRPDSRRVNGNLTARGGLAWGDKSFAASGGQETSGVIIKTGIEGDAALAAQVNGRHYRLSSGSNYIPLPAYGSYKVELMNDKNSMDSFDIVTGRTREMTLYPGNVAVYAPEIKQLVTVFGRMTTGDGRAIANAAVRNHIGHTRTDADGQFSMDVDKRYPVISLEMPGSGVCESELDLSQSHGVEWVGNVVCQQQTTLAQR